MIKLSDQGVSIVPSLRKLLPFGVAVVLAGCAAEPPPAPALMVVPGPNKDLAAFQQDDLVCRQHAAAQTGYGSVSPALSGPAAGVAPPSGGGIAAQPTGIAVPPAAMPENEAGYMQCMAARGDSVRPVPLAYSAAYAAGPYGYGYPYTYGYPYPDVYDGLYGGFGLGFGAVGGWYHGWHRGDFDHRGFAHSGFDHGGFFHGSAGHGGFAHAGLVHGGFGHGGFGHSGFGHSGGGHR